MSKMKIGISIGEDTEDFLTEVLREIDDEALSKMTIERNLEASNGLVGEPITIGVVISGGVIVISAILRIIERRLEYLQQREMMRLVAEGFEKKSELGITLAGMAKKYADVSIEYGLARESWAVTSAPNRHGHNVHNGAAPRSK